MQTINLREGRPSKDFTKIKSADTSSLVESKLDDEDNIKHAIQQKNKFNLYNIISKDLEKKNNQMKQKMDSF